MANTELDTIRILYYRYKETPLYSIGIAVLLVFLVLLLIVRVILPQFESWFSIRSEAEATEARLKVLQGNITFLTGLSDTDLEDKLAVVQTALPFDKDYAGLINAVDSSANNAGISVGDYSFSVGLLATPAAQIKNFYQVPINLSIASSLEGSKKFVKEITENVPLSQILAWDGSTSGSNFSVVFYWKGFPQIILNDALPVRPLTTEQVQILEDLKKWKRTIIENQPIVESTDEATPAAEISQ
ncbi:MAG: hypothetical protein HY430_03680 [Candidatus Levybacteria bacterium]|nr:hypothetical protein [Candidatus Levybacteria bacterium]